MARAPAFQAGACGFDSRQPLDMLFTPRGAIDHIIAMVTAQYNKLDAEFDKLYGEIEPDQLKYMFGMTAYMVRSLCPEDRFRTFALAVNELDWNERE